VANVTNISGNDDGGSLSRMTTKELKQANSTDIPRNSRSNDEDRLQNIIHDIMANKTRSQQENLCDETELTINLEHAHYKIHAMLNRAVAISNCDRETDDE
jgi:hypothetical protein